MHLDLFSCIISFLAVAKQQSFTKAARQLNLSPPVITKQIKLLEKNLTKTLLRRTTRYVELTEAGSVYLSFAKSIVADAEAGKIALSKLEAEPHGEIVISLPTTLSTHFFLASLQQFLLLYPKISCRFISQYSPLTVSEGKADLAINAIDIQDNALIKELLHVSYGKVFASPSYIAQHGKPRTVKDLKHFNCLLNTRLSPADTWEFANNKRIAVQSNYKSDSGADIVLAAVAGFGLIWISELLVKQEVAEKKLVPIELDLTPAKIGVFAYYRPTPSTNKIRLLVEHLKRAIINPA